MNAIFGVNGSLQGWELYSNKYPSAKEDGYISISGISSVPAHCVVFYAGGGTGSLTYQVIRYAWYTRTKFTEILYTPSTKSWITWGQTTSARFGISGTTLRIYGANYWDTTMYFDVLVAK